MSRLAIVLLFTTLSAMHVIGSDLETSNEPRGECLCPEQLPWPNYPFTETNDQLLCGKELMYLVPNTTCVRDAMFSCKVNETKAEFIRQCDTTDPLGPERCSPVTEYDCGKRKNKPKQKIDVECIRTRICDIPNRTRGKIMEIYGKKEKAVCGDHPECSAKFHVY